MVLKAQEHLYLQAPAVQCISKTNWQDARYRLAECHRFL